MAEISTSPKSFPVVLSLQHKVFKLKGGVRNVSMQLQDKVCGIDEEGKASRHTHSISDLNPFPRNLLLLPPKYSFRSHIMRFAPREQQGAYIVFNRHLRHT